MPSNRDSAAADRPEPSGSRGFTALPLAPEEALRLASAARPRWVVDDPRRGAWYGAGAAITLEAGADAPFAIVDQADQLLASLVPLEGPAEVEPVFLGGFAFDPRRTDAGPWRGFPPGRLVLPELLFHLRGARAWALGLGDAAALRAQLEELDERRPEPLPRALTISSEMSLERWNAAVSASLEAFASKRVEKVVLARTVLAELSGPIDPIALLPRLRARHPDCILYVFREGERSFVGATPELLFAREGDLLQTMALAGSVKRDADPARTAQLAAQLLAGAKERREHAFVADAIREALAPLARELELRGPTVRALANIQHLETAIRAELRPGTSTRALLERLHPTPAVCGTPREPARALIRELEDVPRGWYAGAVGFVGRRSSSFAVALRCMLVDGSTARLFAGAGLVEGSEPALEWAETATKTEAMLRVLEGAPT